LKQKRVFMFQPMRGTDTQQSSMFSYLSPEERVSRPPVGITGGGGVRGPVPHATTRAGDTTGLWAYWPIRAHAISNRKAGNILRRRNLAPTPERNRPTTRKELIRLPIGRTRRGRLPHDEGPALARPGDVLRPVFLEVGSRRVRPGTRHPDLCWMEQVGA
jgi:hypothetical protein